jgi:ribonuclease P protein component
MRFRAEQHLRRQRDIRAAREKGRRQECGAFTLWYYRRPAVVAAAGASTLGRSVEPVATVIGPRVAVIASTASVGGAVSRNRAKRRLREVFRQNQSVVPAEYDLLLIARAALNRLEYHEIEQKFVDACRRLFSSTK